MVKNPINLIPMVFTTTTALKRAAKKKSRGLRAFLLLLYILCPVRTGAEGEFYELPDGDFPNHLEPVANHSSQYERRLAKHLLVTGWSCGRLVVIPDSEPESCIAIYPEDIDDPFLPSSEKRYFITLTKASESLWRSMHSKPPKETVEIIRRDREISYELACGIQRAWARMLHNTRYSTRPPRGRGGDKYRFSVCAGDLIELHGEARSPLFGLSAEIVELGKELISFTQEDRHTEVELLTKLKEFESRVPRWKWK